jgi:hypothetical protein
LFLCSEASACGLKGNNEFVILSGPIAHSLKELNLLSNKKIKAITSYANIDKSESGAERLKGGIFLSNKTLSKYKNALFFYDKSFELERVLKNAGLKKRVPFDSIGLTPFEVIQKTKKFLTPYLKNCSKEFKRWDKKLLSFIKQLENLRPMKKPLLFFLGEIKKKERLPNLLMVQDGPVKALLEANKIISYPSPLAYVTWSQKVIDGMSRRPLYIGLVSEAHKSGAVIRRENNTLNIYDPIGLIPGWPQASLLNKLLNHFCALGEAKC